MTYLLLRRNHRVGGVAATIPTGALLVGSVPLMVGSFYLVVG